MLAVMNIFGIDLKKPHTSSTIINIILSLYLVVFTNGPFWSRFSAQLGTSTAGNWVLLFMIGAAICLILNLITSLFSFRPVYKPLIITVLFISAVVNYYMESYGIVINKQMITNLIETDLFEASEQLTIPFFLQITLKAVIPSALITFTRITYRPWRKELAERTIVSVASLLLLFGRAHPELRMYINPTYPIYSFVKAVKQRTWSKSKEPLKIVAPDATRTPSGHKSLFVLVVGETARAEQFSLNGYKRDTNPELKQLDVYNFTDVHSGGTDTAESLPCMFSDLGRSSYSRSEALKRENLLDILKRTGVNVVWLDNNSGSKGVADRVELKSYSGANDPLLCSTEECFDEILLQDFDKLLSENSGDMLLVLHQKGSHGPSYYKRSPKNFKLFTPECTQDNVQDCEQQSIINAYDNTIAYTDHFLASLIKRLQKEKYPTAMLYVSDHGESLGENNIYLHGLPYTIAPKQQTHIPMIFWGSGFFLDEKGIDRTMLAGHQHDQFSHDNLFHTVLGVFQVSASVYDQKLDVFKADR